LVDVISFSQSQSDHIKQLPLYKNSGPLGLDGGETLTTIEREGGREGEGKEERMAGGGGVLRVGRQKFDFFQKIILEESDIMTYYSRPRLMWPLRVRPYLITRNE
jgi:hypothetical protein